MTQSIFEQQDILDKLFLQLKRDYQDGKTSEYNSLVTIAPTMTKDEYEQMIERFTAYMRGKEIDALNEHEVKLRSSLPFLPENMNTGLLGIELELLKHLSAFIVKRDERVASSVQDAFASLREQNESLQQELNRTREALAKSNEALEAMKAVLDEVKQDSLIKQQLIENMSMSVDILDLLQCLNSGEHKLSVESLPVNLKLREDMNDLLSRAKSLSAAEKAALSGMIFKAGDLVKTAKALGFSVVDLKRTSDGEALSALQSKVKDSALSESSKALGSVPPLPEEFRHLEQLGADDSYSDEFGGDDEDVSVSFAKVAAALAAASGNKGEEGKSEIPSSLKAKLGDRVDILARIGRGTADNMSELISAMQGSEGNVIARRLEARQARRDATITKETGTTEAQNYKAAELANLVKERTSGHAERIAAQSCLNALASGDEDDSRSTRESISGPVALAEKIRARVSGDSSKVVDTALLFGQVSALVEDLLQRKQVDELKPQDIALLIAEARKNNAVSRHSPDLIRRLILKSIFVGSQYLVAADLIENDVDLLVSLPTEKARAFARTCIELGHSFNDLVSESSNKYSDSDGDRPTQGSAVSALISGVESDKSTAAPSTTSNASAVSTKQAKGNRSASAAVAASFAAAGFAGAKNSSGPSSVAGRAAAAASLGLGAASASAASASGATGAASGNAGGDSDELAKQSLADRKSVSGDLANVGATLRSEIEGIKSRFDAAFENLNGKTTSVINAQPTAVINGSEPKALPREEGTLVRTMSADHGNDNVAAFAEASAKIEKLAPLLHEAGKEIANARKELENAVLDAKVKEVQERLSDEYTPASKKLAITSNGSFSFGRNGAGTAEKKEEKHAATDEITSVAKDVVKVAYALEEASNQKRERKESLFGGNAEGVTVFGADTRSYDESPSRSESLKSYDSDSSFIDEGEDLSDFVTGNINDIKPIKHDVLEGDHYKEGEDFKVTQHMDPYEQGRLNNPESAQAMQTALSQNTNVVVDNGKYNEPRVTNAFDIGTTTFNFGTTINPNAAPTERAPVQKAADQLKDVLTAALAAGTKNQKGTQGSTAPADGVTTTDTTAIIKSSAPPLAVDPTGRVMGADELRKQQELEAQKAKGDGPSTLITKSENSDTATSDAPAADAAADTAADAATQAEKPEADKASADKADNAQSAEAKPAEEPKADAPVVANDEPAKVVETKAEPADAAKAEDPSKAEASKDAESKTDEAAKVEDESTEQAIGLAMLEAEFKKAESQESGEDKAKQDEASSSEPADKTAEPEAKPATAPETSNDEAEKAKSTEGDEVKAEAKDEESAPAAAPIATSGVSPFAVMIEPSELFVVDAELREEEQRTLNMVSNMLDEKVGGHIKMVKDTLSSAGSLSSFRFADFTSYYRQCIDNLETDGYVNPKLKRILLDKMSYDLKQETISKISYGKGAKSAEESSSASSSSDKSNEGKEASSQSPKADLGANDQSARENADKPQTKEPGFVILDKTETKDETPPQSKGGIASFVNNVTSLFSGSKNDKNNSSSKGTGFFIVKDSDKDDKK